jgi:hypothetical protein
MQHPGANCHDRNLVLMMATILKSVADRDILWPSEKQAAILTIA